VCTVLDILGLAWLSFRPKSVLKSKISGRILKSFRGHVSSAEMGSAKGLVIGKGGETVRELKKESGARVDIVKVAALACTCTSALCQTPPEHSVQREAAVICWPSVFVSGLVHRDQTSTGTADIQQITWPNKNFGILLI
jgi:hypothetical protein